MTQPSLTLATPNIPSGFRKGEDPMGMSLSFRRAGGALLAALFVLAGTSMAFAKPPRHANAYGYYGMPQGYYQNYNQGHGQRMNPYNQGYYGNPRVANNTWGNPWNDAQLHNQQNQQDRMRHQQWQQQEAGMHNQLRQQDYQQHNSW